MTEPSIDTNENLDIQKFEEEFKEAKKKEKENNQLKSIHNLEQKQIQDQIELLLTTEVSKKKNKIVKEDKK